MPAYVAQALKDLRATLVREGVTAAASRHILDRTPHVFRENAESFRRWRNKLGDLIDVDPANITIVGSAGVGFSLNPHKNFRAFNARSDIDVAIISDYHFATAWRSLRAFRLADAANDEERDAVLQHQKRYVYWGCIASDRIIRILPFVTTWTTALSEMAATAPTEGRVINFRIYKDYESLRSYQLNGLQSLQAALLAK
jgi:hypothetical protein